MDMGDAEKVGAGADQQQETGGAGSTTEGSLGSDLTEMVEMKVTAREKMKRIRGFKKFIEKSGEAVEKLQNALGDTVLAARKQESIVAPVENYCIELRERFEEVRCDGWQKQLLKWMKEKAVDTVEELREECEKVVDGNEEEKMELEKENETLRKTNKCLRRLLEDRNLEIADEMEKAEAEVESIRKKLEEAEKLVETLKKAMTKEKKMSENLKGDIEHLESEKKELRKKENRRDLQRDSPRFKGLRRLRKEEWRNTIDGWSRSRDMRKCFNCGGVGHIAKQCTSKRLNVVEAKQKVEDCGAGKKMVETEEKENHVVNVISLDKKEGVKRVEREMKKEKNRALDNANSDRKTESLKEEGMLRKQPQKPIIQEKYVLVGQRLGLRSKAVFEVRTSAIPTWKQKFGWEKVEKAVVLVDWSKTEKELNDLIHLAEEIGEEVKEVIIVPAKMECAYDEVNEVTEHWKKAIETAANIELVDPMQLVGMRKTPLIRSELKPRSLEQMVEYLENAIPSHPLVDRLRAEVEDSEPRMKNHRAN